MRKHSLAFGYLSLSVFSFVASVMANLRPHNKYDNYAIAETKPKFNMPFPTPLECRVEQINNRTVGRKSIAKRAPSVVAVVSKGLVQYSFIGQANKEAF